MLPTRCLLCEHFANAISSLLSRQPETLDLVPLELLSGQVLYERADEVQEEDLFSGFRLIANAQCSMCTTLADSIIRRAFHKASDPLSSLKTLNLKLSGPMCKTGCFMLQVSESSGVAH
jgi:hypothetical protein